MSWGPGELNPGDQAPLFSLPSGHRLENELQIAPLKCLTARISQIELQGLRKENSGCWQSGSLVVVDCVYSQQWHCRLSRLPLPPTSSPASAIHHATPGLTAALRQVSRLFLSILQLRRFKVHWIKSLLVSGWLPIIQRKLPSPVSRPSRPLFLLSVCFLARRATGSVPRVLRASAQRAFLPRSPL